MARRFVLAVVAVVLLATSAFAATARTQAEPLTIYAAASLTDVFRALDPAQSYSFAGSNTLETQIKNGAPADIFASAAPLNTQRLFRAGLVDKPVTFTANRLALIVPQVEPGGHPLRLRPQAEAGQARDRRAGGAGRRLHANGAPQDGADLGAVEGREPGVGRPGGHRQGRARPGRRRASST